MYSSISNANRDIKLSREYDQQFNIFTSSSAFSFPGRSVDQAKYKIRKKGRNALSAGSTDFSNVVKDLCRVGTDNFDINLQEKTPFLAQTNTRNNFTLKQMKANNLRQEEIIKQTWKLSFNSPKEAFRFSLYIKEKKR